MSKTIVIGNGIVGQTVKGALRLLAGIVILLIACAFVQVQFGWNPIDGVKAVLGPAWDIVKDAWPGVQEQVKHDVRDLPQ